jgi:hypothetical protein
MTRPRVEVSNGVINQMVNDPKFTQVFPFLTSFVTQVTRTSRVGGCRCRKKAIKAVTTTSQQINYNGIRMQIVTMPNAKKIKLKQLLAAKQLRVTYKNPQGKIRAILF